jgi:hypothetical protein
VPCEPPPSSTTRPKWRPSSAGLPAAFLKGNKLLAQIDEGHGITPAAQFEAKQAAIERQRLDIPDLQRDVVEAYDTRSRDSAVRTCSVSLKD